MDYQKYVNKLIKDEGVPPVKAFLAAFDKAKADGQNPSDFAIEGTHECFEAFTKGFTAEKKEKIRAIFHFTD